jgi:hypothetical protein
MVFAVVVTTLLYTLFALALVAELVGQSNPHVGLALIALVIGGVGLGMLPFAEVWTSLLTIGGAALTTLVVGVASTTMGGAHLMGVLGNVWRGAYPLYDFRLASMLSIGIMMVVAGTVCIAAARGLRRAQPRAWDLALAGTILLILVALPLCFVPFQGDLAAILTFLAIPNLAVLVLTRRQLGEHRERQPS